MFVVARHEAEEYGGKREAILSKRLLKKAHKLRALPEGFWQHDDWEVDEYGNKFLSSSTYAKVEQLVIEKKRKDWEFRAKVIVPIAGTVIGLIAVLQRCGPPTSP